jgi:SAM-dependent methyltransferase
MTQSSLYGALAAAYENPDHTQVSHAFHARLRPILGGLEAGARVVELGCGSGLLTELLAKEGFRVVGFDSSPAMLALARRRCRRLSARVVLAQGEFGDDIRASEAALVVACGDVINHLPARVVVRRAFRLAARCLRPGGRLAFDVLNRWCFENYWRDRTYYFEGAGGELVMRCSWDGMRGIGTARTTGYIRLPRGLRRRHVVDHTERLYEPDEIRQDLRASGFATAQCDAWSPWPDQHLEPSRDRQFWIATRS